MDYNVKRGTIGLAVILVLMVLSIVIIVNWRAIDERFGVSDSQSTVSATLPVSAENAETSGSFVRGGQLGHDLYAWQNDETFFDSDEPEEIIERMVIEKKPAQKETDREVK